MDSIDEAIRDRDVDQLLNSIQLILSQDKSKFNDIDLCLRQHAFDPQFLVQCINTILEKYPERIDVANVLLDGVSFTDALPLSPATASTAVQPFFLLLESKRHRLAVKLCTTFYLNSHHLAQHETDSSAAQDRLITQLKQLSKTSSGVSSAVSLILHFQLQEHFDMATALALLTINGQEKTAADFASILPHHVQTALVDQCILGDRLRAACHIVDALTLHELYPTVHAEYKKQCMEKAVAKQLWSVSSGIAEGHPELQIELVNSMIAVGEGLLAREFCEVMDLNMELFDFTGCSLTEEEMQRRREKYIDIDLSRFWFVDSLAALQSYSHKLELVSDISQSTTSGGQIDNGVALPIAVVGLDVEWKPGNSRSSQPSLLQLSTDTEVLVVDLLAITTEFAHALDLLLQPLLLDPSVYKLGVGITQDLAKLAAAFPHISAFSVVNGCIDLSKLWRSQLATRPEYKATHQSRNEISLTTLSNITLGKPLDKSMQLSNWDRRPLLEAQLRYAALDALAAVQIFRRFGEIEPTLATHQGLATSAISWKAGSTIGDSAGNPQQAINGSTVIGQKRASSSVVAAAAVHSKGPVSAGKCSSNRARQYRRQAARVAWHSSMYRTSSFPSL